MVTATSDPEPRAENAHVVANEKIHGQKIVNSS